MVRICLAALRLDGRVTSVFVPYLRPHEWSRTKLYLPSSFVMCTTNKDSDDVDKVRAWETFGWKSRLIDVSDTDILSSTAFRLAILSGRDWREFMHESIHEYFTCIDGPARFLRSAALANGHGR